MSDIYFAKVPFRNAYLHVRNRFPSAEPFTDLILRYDVDVVLDVGANKGQYGRKIIGHGFRGRIVSFEPLPSAFEKLRLNRWSFSSWQIEPIALGDEDATATLNVASNSLSSSLRGMLPIHAQSAPGAAYVSSCEVSVRRLDSIFERYCRPGERCFMKLDVQGHERSVIEGAAGCLDSIVAIQMEMSMQPLYEGEQTWQQAIEMMQQLGYQLVLITPGFRDRRTGVMLQADGVFVRRQAVEQLQAA